MLRARARGLPPPPTTHRARHPPTPCPAARSRLRALIKAEAGKDAAASAVPEADRSPHVKQAGGSRAGQGAAGGRALASAPAGHGRSLPRPPSPPPHQPPACLIHLMSDV